MQALTLYSLFMATDGGGADRLLADLASGATRQSVEPWLLQFLSQVAATRWAARANEKSGPFSLKSAFRCYSAGPTGNRAETPTSVGLRQSMGTSKSPSTSDT